MIPREVDDLMWAIAEGTDSDAIEAFGDRYPALREELLKRIRTVNALKAGNRPIKAVSVPTFKNTKVQPANKNLVWVTFGFAVLAMFSFGIFRLNSNHAPLPSVQSVNLAPVKLPEANIPKAPEVIPTQPQQNNPNGEARPYIPQNEQNQPASEPISGGPKTLKLEATALQSAILMIGEAGHYTINIAPGMPNPPVTVNFVDMEPLAMLKELGEQYAFTAVVDGPRSFLILPKKDEDEGQIVDNH